MALVHQKLYQSQNLADISLKEYISELSGLLFDSIYDASSRIELELDLEDIHVSIDIAIPCGLILNELISNSLKYAFTEGSPAKISIRLRNLPDDIMELTVSDNGKGLPRGFDAKKMGKMGLTTVFAICEQQLRGRVQMVSENGLTARLSFSKFQH
jgi:two-component sensor histidine kinase